MDFRIAGLPSARFAHLFGLDDAELARHRAVRRVCDEKPGFPCRVSLADAEPGERVLLVNYDHLDVDSPYRASHAIYVRERDQESFDELNTLPEALRTRLLAIRGFDAQGMMLAAEVVEGREARPLIERYLDNPEIIQEYLNEALATKDEKYIAKAIGTVARAKGMTDIAEATGLGVFDGLLAAHHDLLERVVRLDLLFHLGLDLLEVLG